MQFSTPPSSILFAKVSIKTKPYSAEPVSIRIIADSNPNATINKALLYSELPLKNTTLESVNAKIQQFVAQNNFATAVVKIQPKVLKVLNSKNS